MAGVLENPWRRGVYDLRKPQGGSEHKRASSSLRRRWLAWPLVLGANRQADMVLSANPRLFGIPGLRSDALAAGKFHRMLAVGGTSVMVVPETMKKLILTIAPLAAALALTGCFQSETTIHVKADGSGTVVEETTLGAQMSAMLGGLGGLGGAAEDQKQPAKDPLDDMFSADKAKQQATEMGEGVTFEKLEKIDKDGKKGARITYKFADINKLKFNPDQAASGMENMGGGAAALGEEAGAKIDEAKKKSKPITFECADGKLTVHMPPMDSKGKAKEDAADKPKEEAAKDAAEGEKPDAAEQAQAEQMMKMMFADMKIGLRLAIDPGIAETDATYVDGNKITLMEMNFGELMANPDGLKKMQELEGKKPEEIAEAVKGLKGVRVETKDTFSVKIK
jgi:hypothetical protein